MIGYYVHHQGAGHLTRMRSIAQHLSTPVTVLSSLDPPADCDLPWVRLARDDRGPGPVDPTARGTLHWVPRHDDGLRARTRQVVDWVASAVPVLVVVDVSVEMALLVRLTGTPVVVVAMPGLRDDRPHRTAFDLADGFLAALPSASPLGDWPEQRVARTDFVGAISRFDGRPAPSRRASRASGSDGPALQAGGDRDGGHGLLLWGQGGGAPTPYDVQQLRRATPGWTWEVAGSPEPWSADEVWSALGRADVVVSHAGQNAVAELAAARAPAVVVAAPRPFDEQQHTVRALTEAGIAEGLAAWPEPERWPDLLRRAEERGGGGWARWSHGDGARRAAVALEAHVDRLAALSGPAGGLRQPASSGVAPPGVARVPAQGERLT